MSLPGLDFNEWDKRNPKDEEDSTSLADIGVKDENDIGSRNTDGCEKCSELRKKCEINDHNGEGGDGNNNNESETGALCCKCSAKIQLNMQKFDTTSSDDKPKVPRRNLTLKRQITREVETRALISRVAEYYESYVDEMNLTKYFLNDAIVTCVCPIKMCRDNFNGKFKGAKWIVSG